MRRSFFVGFISCGENFRGNSSNTWRLGIGAGYEQRQCSGLERLWSSFKGQNLKSLIEVSVKWLAMNPTWAILSRVGNSRCDVWGVPWTLMNSRSGEHIFSGLNADLFRGIFWNVLLGNSFPPIAFLFEGNQRIKRCYRLQKISPNKKYIFLSFAIKCKWTKTFRNLK